MKALRTPDERFANLADYPFEPNYTTIQAHDGTELRIHHLDEGPSDGPVVLCMHGQPVWSYLYRKMIPHLVKAGLRVIAPDLVGYGKSDKPAAREDYSYERQVEWLGKWLEANDFKNLTFFGQDWGGLIGLRLVVNHDERFNAVVISNTGLPYNPDVPQEVVDDIEAFRNDAPTPTLLGMQRALSQMGDGDPARKFAYWQKFCWETVDLPIGFMMSMMLEKRSNASRALRLLLNKIGLGSVVASDIQRAYEAPFPDATFKMGPRAMPSQVPTLPTSPSLAAQANAWAFFEKFEKPFICAFADDDPVTAGGAAEFKARVPGAQGREHPTVPGGGHFVQENAPEAISRILINLVREG